MEGIPFNLVCAVSGNFKVRVKTKRPEVRGRATDPRGHGTGPQILHCSRQSWLKVIKNTSWSDSQSVFPDNASEKALACR